MCTSPAGAFRVQAPDFARALATVANAQLAATPPTTIRVMRFITDLRMKGDTTAPAPSRCYLVMPRPGSRLSVAPVAQARRVKRLRRRGRRAALKRGAIQNPPA